MFIDEHVVVGSVGEYPRQLDGGRWLVHAGSAEYRSWAFWLAVAFGKKFFPDPVLAVWGRWPPMTQEGADDVAQRISEVRDAIKWCEAVPRHPLPWDGDIPPAVEHNARPGWEHKPWAEIAGCNPATMRADLAQSLVSYQTYR